MDSSWFLIILFAAVLTAVCLAALLVIIWLYYWGPSRKPTRYRDYSGKPKG